MDVNNALQPIRRILVGEKPTRQERHATDLAVAVARHLQARVRVLEVEPAHPLLEKLGVEAEAPGADGHFQCHRSPLEIADAHGLPAERLEVVRRRGRARDLILEEALDWDADLVVIGRASMDSVPRILLGTVTDSLVRNLTCPLLVSRGGPFPPHEVLFPVDLSPSSAEAAVCGLDFLRQANATAAHCHALLVLPSDLSKVALATAQRELDDFLVTQLDPEREPIAGELGFGDPAAVVLETARRLDDDLIVLGTHGTGSGPIERHKVGSVVAPVLFEPPCNVLLVPPAAQLGAELAAAVAGETAPRFGG